jgi:hypothetical protein
VGNCRAKGKEKLRADYRRIAEHAGKYKARVAAARKLLTLVFYAMRDGEVRLATPHRRPRRGCATRRRRQRQAFGVRCPTLTPASRWRALSRRTPMGESGTMDRKRLLIRLRPFMYGDRGHPRTVLTL